MTVNGALGALKRALKACDLSWSGKLDQYSFRRWWVDSADAEGIPLGDAMKQAGHAKAETHVGYRRNSKRSVPPATVERVRSRRLRGGGDVALHGHEGQPRSFVATGSYAASSLCSREHASPGLSPGVVRAPGASPPQAEHVESRRVTSGRVLSLESSEHAQVLASLLNLGPGVRRALAALAQGVGEQQGVLDALAELWPDEFQPKSDGHREARREA